MRVRLMLWGMSDTAWVRHPEGDHVTLPLDAALIDDAAVEAMVRGAQRVSASEMTALPKGIKERWRNEARAALSALLAHYAEVANG